MIAGSANKDEKAEELTVAILQPSYLPWLGYFEQMSRSDIFVYYDDVQFDKHGWRNRNRIKTPNGPHWLTAPVLHKGQGKPLVSEIEIDNKAKWAKKHIGTIQQYYGKAAFYKTYKEELEELLTRHWGRLVDLDIATINMMCGWMGLSPKTFLSSELLVDGGQSERLVNICKLFSATKYLSGAAARDYLDADLFKKEGIKVEWQDYQHPVYPQLHGEFISHLSALDLLLNAGEESMEIILSKDV